MYRWICTPCINNPYYINLDNQCFRIQKKERENRWLKSTCTSIYYKYFFLELALPDLFQHWLIDPEELKIEEKLGEGNYNEKFDSISTAFENRSIWNSIQSSMETSRLCSETNKINQYFQ
jgi:hypothetical protein